MINKPNIAEWLGLFTALNHGDKSAERRIREALKAAIDDADLPALKSITVAMMLGLGLEDALDAFSQGVWIPS